MENKSGIYPTGDMILISPLLVEEKSAGGIVIASEYRQKEQMAMHEGQMIAWGSAANRESRLQGVNLGDLVGFAKWAGQLKTGKDGVEYRLMRAADVVCKLDMPSLDMPAVRVPLNPETEFSL